MSSATETAAAAAFDRAPVPAAILDSSAAAGAAIVRANDSLAELLGCSAGELTGRRLGDLVALPDAELGSEPVACAVRGEPSIALELRAAELPGGAVVQLADVGDRRRTERSLRDQARRLQDIIDNCAALVYMKSTDGRYLLVNRQFERRFGLSREDAIGRTDFELFPDEAARAYVEHDRQVLATARAMEVEEPATPEPLEVEEPAVELDRSWLSIKFALLGERGEPYALAGISTDITDRKRAEAAAREARDEAERANRAKSDFLSRMSHELRTPLNSILGFGQLLELEPLPKAARSSAEHILTAGDHLLKLIDEVLEISRIEAGAQRLSVEPVDACAALQDALELVRPLAHERGIELASDMHAGLDRYVLADLQRLEQVLLNLLSNAIKYNRRDGAVRACFARRGERLRFLIVDTGPGLRDDERERAFMPFERLAAGEAGIEGTGLGLALSRSLAEAMGGRVGIQHSAPGEGSTFFVELALGERPACEPAGASGERAATAALGAIEDATVLYVEDNLSNLELVERILSHAGSIELIPAMQGALALDLAAQHRPDLVLLDLHLPDLDGAEVLRRLRRDRRTRRIPVVVLSADATPRQMERLAAQGIAGYITKPIKVGRFLDTLRRALESR